MTHIHTETDVPIPIVSTHYRFMDSLPHLHITVRVFLIMIFLSTLYTGLTSGWSELLTFKNILGIIVLSCITTGLLALVRSFTYPWNDKAIENMEIVSPQINDETSH